ncbi:MAG: glutamate racemase [Thermoleophilaceae bacterium]|nr:glutamate racemase [Thermoleophilaceae bacterium]
MTSFDRSQPVGVFDSGLGGLTVLHECLVTLPHEDFVYFGDTGHFPYGGRTPEELTAFSFEMAEQLLREGAKLIVVACNTATAAALPALRAEYAGHVEVIGVISPEARQAGEATRNGRVGLLATEATVASGAYERALAEVAPDATLVPVACPGLAPLIQREGLIDQLVVDEVEQACEPLREADVDTVILGCTHYPLVRAVIQRALGRGVRIVTSGHAIADDVDRALQAAGLANDQTRRGGYRFLCSGDPESFRRMGTRFLQLPLGEVRHVEVAATRELVAARSEGRP